MRRAALPLILIGVLAAAPLPAASGSLSIESQPGVDVVWDGTPLGRTDANGTMQIEGIPAGEYVLELSKAGYQSQRQRVVITEEPATHHGYLESLAPVEPTPTPPVEVPRPKPEVSAEPAPSAATTTQTDPTRAAAQPEPLPERAPASAATAAEDVLEPPEAVATIEPESAKPAAASAARIPSIASEAEGGGTALQLLLALAIAVAGGLAIFLTGRRPSAVAPTQASRAAEPRVEKPVSPPSDDSRFIESLKARERAMDGSSSDVAEIIDVEFVDIQEIEGDT